MTSLPPLLVRRDNYEILDVVKSWEMRSDIDIIDINAQIQSWGSQGLAFWLNNEGIEAMRIAEMESHQFKSKLQSRQSKHIPSSVSMYVNAGTER